MICMEMFGSGFQIITVKFITVELRMEWLIRKARQRQAAGKNVVIEVDITGEQKLIYGQRKIFKYSEGPFLNRGFQGLRRSMIVQIIVRIAMQGFLLITVLVLTLLIGGVMLSFF